ncbi:sensor histidine kinase [Motilibacter deserti]|uniref:histidine kinase n=1 Tax=Motilibacter deserti TaxID=2714956 RepID=A0ABX0GMX7_9ACTN|nr:HAMP domain-containing sensor histidine kinase [Motilibacter deserti]NHC12177.1 HAMP domain-containing histidine kinase [Motilibacter deserti]
MTGHPAQREPAPPGMPLARAADQRVPGATLDADVRDAFLALMSHELRTPLTSALGHLELLLDGIVGPLSDEQALVARSAENGAKRLLRLVEDLLLVAGAGAGDGQLALDRQPVDLLDVAGAAAAARARPAQRGGVALEVVPCGTVVAQGDRARLVRMVEALVCNAVAFTPPGGAVRVEVRALDGWAAVDVADTGVGIPADERTRVLERFYRGSATRHDGQPGVGLGLAVAREVAASHGGTLSIVSEPGAGTTARATFPTGPDAPPTPPHAAPALLAG